jgi:hypothetical protein
MQRANGCGPTREDRQIQMLDPRHVPHQPIHDKPRDPAMFGFGTDDIPYYSIHPANTMRVHNNDIVWLGNIQRLVNHEIVARKYVNGAHWPAQPMAPIRLTFNGRIQSVKPV